jgi:hypothetical protein
MKFCLAIVLGVTESQHSHQQTAHPFGARLRYYELKIIGIRTNSRFTVCV